MKTKSLLNAIKKTGLEVKQGHSSTNFYVNGPRNVLSFYVQGDKAICVHVAEHGDVSDSMRDYHAGHFLHTIKYAIECLLEPKRGV